MSSPSIKFICKVIFDSFKVSRGTLLVLEVVVTKTDPVVGLGKLDFGEGKTESTITELSMESHPCCGQRAGNRMAEIQP